MMKEEGMDAREPSRWKAPGNIAGWIDYALLRPEATEVDVRRVCWEAEEYGFATVCVHPTYVHLASQLLYRRETKVCTVVGFPLGMNLPGVKTYEARCAMDDGAREIDMVMHIGALKGGEDEVVYREIGGVVEVCREEDVLVKIIIETPYLTREEKVEACQLACRAGADYVKTCTGFGPGGASVQDVMLMKEVVQKAGMGIKAAGGIRTYEDARKMMDAGATRIGTSAGVQIVKESRKITE